MTFKLSRLLSFSVLALFVGFAATANAGGGKAIFDAKKCGGCHQTKGPAKEKTIKDMLKKKGPELWYVGSKLQEEFLKGWLQDPKPIRPMAFYSLTKKNPGDHPKLSAKDAGEVTEYLMSLKSKDVKAGAIKPKKNIKGKLVFKKKQGCYGCHLSKKGKKITGGMTGPTLVGASKRLNPDWIYAYMTNPKVFKPVKDMPVYVGVLNDTDMKNVSEYVSNLP
ncbi:MAG: c-type cytochrome [Thermodesulfobacteriota bacterium]